MHFYIHPFYLGVVVGVVGTLLILVAAAFATGKHKEPNR